MRSWLLVAASIPLVAGALVWRHVERVDDGYIISTSAGVIDPVGELKLAYIRATRQCGAVAKSDSEQAMAAPGASDFGAPSSRSVAKPRAAWSQGEWLLVEADFENLEPAIVLLRKQPSGFNVQAVYSGTAAPFNDVQVIHEYLAKKSADSPTQLINCYEPVGPPFDRAS